MIVSINTLGKYYNKKDIKYYQDLGFTFIERDKRNKYDDDNYEIQEKEILMDANSVSELFGIIRKLANGYHITVDVDDNNDDVIYLSIVDVRDMI